jgi:hypothetical protein
MRKKVIRVDSEDPPEWCCNECWFFEARDSDSGACYGHPPQIVIDDEGDPVFMRVYVNNEDRGCAIWKARHRA